MEGIKALLTGKFTESIEKMDFEKLFLDEKSVDEKRELKSRFRSSQMLYFSCWCIEYLWNAGNEIF